MRSALKKTTMLVAASAVLLLLDHSAADARRWHGHHRQGAVAKSHGHARAIHRGHHKKRIAHHRKLDRLAGAFARANGWEGDQLSADRPAAEMRMSQWAHIAPEDARLETGAPSRGYRGNKALARRSDDGRRGRKTARAMRVARADHSGTDAGFATSGGNSVVSEARRWIGSNPTGRSSLWCARFMNFVLDRTGHGGTGSDLARSFAAYGTRVSGPQVGAIAVMGRRGGGHVGVVSGIDDRGNPIVISGNHNRRVAEAVYPRGRVYAYVMPR
jgi:uncharacterized protein (TIGR02594 family)